LKSDFENVLNSLRCVSVIKADPNPYAVTDMPSGPIDPERFEDGYGTLIPNKSNEQAETDKHPEFSTKTDIVRKPDYGQGVTMDVGFNL
jgi:hypothetical protein